MSLMPLSFLSGMDDCELIMRMLYTFSSRTLQIFSSFTYIWVLRCRGADDFDDVSNDVATTAAQLMGRDVAGSPLVCAISFGNDRTLRSNQSVSSILACSGCNGPPVCLFLRHVFNQIFINFSMA
jgi:hypothetical protein